MPMISIDTTCPICKKNATVVVDKIRYALWRQKRLSIQDAFPDLTLDEREALKTGICPKCWDDNLSDPDPVPMTYEQLASVIAGLTPEQKQMPVEVYSEHSKKHFMVYGLHISGKNDMFIENQPYLAAE